MELFRSRNIQSWALGKFACRTFLNFKKWKLEQSAHDFNSGSVRNVGEEITTKPWRHIRVGHVLLGINRGCFWTSPGREMYLHGFGVVCFYGSFRIFGGYDFVSFLLCFFFSTTNPVAILSETANGFFIWSIKFIRLLWNYMVYVIPIESTITIELIDCRIVCSQTVVVDLPMEKSSAARFAKPYAAWFASL